MDSYMHGFFCVSRSIGSAQSTLQYVAQLHAHCGFQAMLQIHAKWSIAIRQ